MKEIKSTVVYTLINNELRVRGVEWDIEQADCVVMAEFEEFDAKAISWENKDGSIEGVLIDNICSYKIVEGNYTQDKYLISDDTENSHKEKTFSEHLLELKESGETICNSYMMCSQITEFLNNQEILHHISKGFGWGYYKIEQVEEVE